MKQGKKSKKIKSISELWNQDQIAKYMCNSSSLKKQNKDRTEYLKK